MTDLLPKPGLTPELAEGSTSLSILRSDRKNERDGSTVDSPDVDVGVGKTESANSKSQANKDMKILPVHSVSLPFTSAGSIGVALLTSKSSGRLASVTVSAVDSKIAQQKHRMPLPRTNSWHLRAKDVETALRDFPARITVDEAAYLLDHTTPSNSVEKQIKRNASGVGSLPSSPSVPHLTNGLLQIASLQTVNETLHGDANDTELELEPNLPRTLLKPKPAVVSAAVTHRSYGAVSSLGSGIQIASAPPQNSSSIAPTKNLHGVTLNKYGAHQTEVAVIRSQIRERTKEALRLRKILAWESRLNPPPLPGVPYSLTSSVSQTVPSLLPSMTEQSHQSTAADGILSTKNNADSRDLARGKYLSGQSIGTSPQDGEPEPPMVDTAFLIWLRNEDNRLSKSDLNVENVNATAASSNQQFLPQLVKYARQLTDFAASTKLGLQRKAQKEQMLLRRVKELELIRKQIEHDRDGIKAMLMHEKESREHLIALRIKDEVDFIESEFRVKAVKMENDAEMRARESTFAEVQKRIEAGEEPIRHNEIEGGKSWLARMKRMRHDQNLAHNVAKSYHNIGDDLANSLQKIDFEDANVDGRGKNDKSEIDDHTDSQIVNGGSDFESSGLINLYPPLPGKKLSARVAADSLKRKRGLHRPGLSPISSSKMESLDEDVPAWKLLNDQRDLIERGEAGAHDSGDSDHESEISRQRIQTDPQLISQARKEERDKRRMARLMARQRQREEYRKWVVLRSGHNMDHEANFEDGNSNSGLSDNVTTDGTTHDEAFEDNHTDLESESETLSTSQTPLSFSKQQQRYKRSKSQTSGYGKTIASISNHKRTIRGKSLTSNQKTILPEHGVKTDSLLTHPDSDLQIDVGINTDNMNHGLKSSRNSESSEVRVFEDVDLQESAGDNTQNKAHSAYETESLDKQSYHELLQIIQRLREELADKSLEVIRTKETAALQVAAAIQEAQQAKERSETRIQKLEKDLDVSLQQEKTWEQRFSDYREREEKSRNELEDKHKTENENHARKLGELSEKLDAERVKARTERSELQESSRSLQAQLHAQLTGHLAKDRLFAEREGQIAVLNMAKATVERQLESMKLELDALRSRESIASQVASELPNKVQTLRSKLASTVSSLNIAQVDLMRAAAAACGLSPDTNQQAVVEALKKASSEVGLGQSASSLSRQQALALSALSADALKRQAELELETTTKDAELDQLRFAFESCERIRAELNEVRKRADSQSIENQELRAALDKLVKESPLMAKQAAERQLSEQSAGKKENLPKGSLKVDSHDEDDDAYTATDRIEAGSGCKDVTDEFKNAPEELSKERKIIPIIALPNFAIKTKKGKLIRASDLLNGLQSSDSLPGGEPTAILSKLRETQMRLSETETDLITLSQRYSLLVDKVDVLKEDYDAMAKRYKAEMSLNLSIKALAGGQGSILTNPNTLSTGSVESKNKAAIEKVHKAMEQMYKQLYEESEQRVEKLRKTIDSQRAELSQAKSNQHNAEVQVRELTERLHGALQQVTSLESMLEGLGLSAEALKRANDIIATFRQGYNASSPNPMDAQSGLLSPSIGGGGASPDTSNVSLVKAKQAVQLALEIDSLRAQITELQGALSTSSDRIKLLEVEIKNHEEFSNRVERFLDTENSLSHNHIDQDESKKGANTSKEKVLAGQLATLQRNYIKTSQQLAQVSMSHLACPSVITKLQAELKESTSVLESSKVEFARRRGQLEMDLALERDRSTLAASKLRELQEAAADRRAELRLEYERALTVLRETNRKLEEHVHSLAIQLQQAGIEPKSFVSQ